MIALVLLLACVGGPGDGGALPSADEGRFVADVEPVLEARCATSSCHGRADRPLQVYAPGLYRAEPADRWRDTPLTDDELQANFDHARAFLADVARAADSELVGKPLAPDAGGMLHGGGTQFEDTAEPEWRAIDGWAEDALEAP